MLHRCVGAVKNQEGFPAPVFGNCLPIATDFSKLPLVRPAEFATPSKG